MIIGISEAQEKIINEILNPYFKEFSFFYYGSRVKGGFEATSDLDILIKAKNEPKKNKISFETLERIKDNFVKSDLPFLVNFSDYAGIDERFYGGIKGQLIRVDFVLKKIEQFATVTSSKRIFLKDYVKEGIPFWRSKEVIEQFKGVDISTELFIDKKKYSEIREKFGVPEIGDILLTSVGTIGIPYLVKNHAKFYFKDGNLTWIKSITKDINSKYLFLWLGSSVGRGIIDGYLIGSSQKALTINSLKKIEIPVPSITVQKKIAGILSAYDDLIEKNNKRIKILEEMAQILYKEWFVDFKFPNHQNTKFINSELGKIPEGWEVELVENILDRRKAGNKYNQSNVLKEGKTLVIDQSTNEILGYHNNEADHKASLESAIIIFGDHTCKMQMMIESFSVGENVIPFVAKNKSLSSFVYLLVKSLVNTKEYKRHWTELINNKIILPSLGLQLEYSNKISFQIKKVNELKRVNKNLKQTRDLLLPRLISGELSVENLEVQI